MIKIDRGTTEIAGDPAELVAETALMLMSIYVIAKDELGEAGAREMIEAWMPMQKQPELYERRE